MPDYRTQYDERRVAILRDHIPAGSGLAVDIGCNDGTITALLADRGYRPFGFDLDADLIAGARAEHPAIDFHQGSAEAAEELGPRNLTLCLEVLEHVGPEEQEAMVRSISRSTAKGGLVVLSTPGRYSLFSLYERVRHRLQGRRGYDWWDPTHVNVLSFRQLRRLLMKHRLRIVRLTGYHYLPGRLGGPVSTDLPLLSRMGFDLIVVAERV